VTHKTLGKIGKAGEINMRNDKGKILSFKREKTEIQQKSKTFNKICQNVY